MYLKSLLFFACFLLSYFLLYACFFLSFFVSCFLWLLRPIPGRRVSGSVPREPGLRLDQPGPRLPLRRGGLGEGAGHEFKDHGRVLPARAEGGRGALRVLQQTEIRQGHQLYIFGF